MNLNNKKISFSKGFTMLELVIIVSIILGLGAAVVIWIDPVERIGAAKQAKRQDDVTVLSVAFSDYAKTHKGALPVLGTVTTTKKVICNNQTNELLTCDADIEYCLKIDDADFFNKNITNLPIDPDKSSDSDTGYYIQKDANNNIIIGACDHTFGYAYDRPQLRATCDAYGGGYCWYGGTESTASCDTICEAEGLSCATINQAADTLCLLGDAGSASYSCGTCTAGTSGDAPSWLSANTCKYQVDTLDCSGANTANPVCPCQ
ncbi:MAG: Type secretion system protein [Patescibacteria group bacterium]|nr:Type secretion system protein [Patescibacteria group bacterium]MDQ5970839.1 Type secretion system protein [Patescibacteria group bacterium]